MFTGAYTRTADSGRRHQAVYMYVGLLVKKSVLQRTGGRQCVVQDIYSTNTQGKKVKMCLFKWQKYLRVLTAEGKAT